MANRGFDTVGTVKKGVVKLYGAFPTTTSGTLATSGFTSARKAGFTLAKTAAKTGRYDVALQDKYIGLLNVDAKPNGAADAAYTTAKGVKCIPRNVAVAGSATANGTLQIQMVRTDTGADAEVEDGATLYVEITLDNSSQ